jgi:UDP-N-acetyl-D-galactosamine dehydrogenase
MVREDPKLALIGLGYLGMPVAVAFEKSRPVVGFDIRIAAHRGGRYRALEVTAE